MTEDLEAAPVQATEPKAKTSAGFVDPSLPNPELGRERLLAEPQVALLWKRKERLQLYELLRRRLKREPDRDIAAAIVALLQNRRLFLEPSDAPLLATLNGVGWRFYGSAEPQRDRTYIATHYFTVVWVPILPLGDYVVSDGTNKDYLIHGRVPLTQGKALWRRVVGWMLFFLFLMNIAFYVADELWPTLYVVNGFTQPVQVRLGKETLVVPASGMTKATVSRGPLEVETRDGSGQLKLLSEKITIPSQRSPTLIYNVLGGAALWARPVHYRPRAEPTKESEATEEKKEEEEEKEAKKEEEEAKLYIGDHLIVRDKIEYLFTPPDKSIKMPAGKSTLVHWHLDRLPGGAKRAIDLLLTAQRTPEATALARNAVLLDSSDESLVHQSLSLTQQQEGLGPRLALAQLLRSRFPSASWVHREYQDALIEQGHRDQAIAEYQTGGAAKVPAALANALSVRAYPRAEALLRADQLLAEHPGDPELLAQRVLLLVEAARYRDALIDLELLRSRDPSRASQLWEARATALVADHQTEQALHALTALCAGQEDAWLPFAQVVKLLPSGPDRPEPAACAKKLVEAGAPEILLDALTAQIERLPPAASRKLLLSQVEYEVLSIDALTPREPQQALYALRNAAPAVQRLLSSQVTLLLAAELSRKQQPELARGLIDAHSGLFGCARSALIGFLLHNEEQPELEELPHALRAVLAVIRADRATNGADKERWQTRARELDVLPGLATAALPVTPPAAPAGPPRRKRQPR